MLKPEDLKEADTDVSSVLKFNGHAETVQKVWDVVKKTAYGVDFVLWGWKIRRGFIMRCRFGI